MRCAVIVEVNSETDFVARNDLFQRLVGQVAAAALALPAPTEHTAQLIPLEQVLHSLPLSLSLSQPH